jgi:hypothetical protein
VRRPLPRSSLPPIILRTHTRELTFADVLVPEDNLLGPRGMGFKQFLQILDGGRISIETSDTLGGASFRVWLPLAPITHAADDTSGLHGMFDD